MFISKFFLHFRYESLFFLIRRNVKQIIQYILYSRFKRKVDKFYVYLSKERRRPQKETAKGLKRAFLMLRSSMRMKGFYTNFRVLGLIEIKSQNLRIVLPLYW